MVNIVQYVCTFTTPSKILFVLSVLHERTGIQMQSERFKLLTAQNDTLKQPALTEKSEYIHSYSHLVILQTSEETKPDQSHCNH